MTKYQKERAQRARVSDILQRMATHEEGMEKQAKIVQKLGGKIEEMSGKIEEMTGKIEEMLGIIRASAPRGRRL